MLIEVLQVILMLKFLILLILLNVYLVRTNYQIFTVPQKNKQMVNYLFQWVQSWQHMVSTSTLNKRQIKN